LALVKNDLLDNNDQEEFNKAVSCTRGFTIAAIVIGSISILIAVGVGIWYAIVIAAAVQNNWQDWGNQWSG